MDILEEKLLEKGMIFYRMIERIIISALSKILESINKDFILKWVFILMQCMNVS